MQPFKPEFKIKKKKIIPLLTKVKNYNATLGSPGTVKVNKLPVICSL